MAKKFDIRDRLGYRVQNISNKMILLASRTYAEKFNAGVQEWRVLTVLMLRGEGTAKEICDFTLMDKGNVSRTVRKMVKEGNLKQKLDPDDKRSTILYATPKGTDLFRRIKKVSDAREKRLLASLSASERKALPNILTKLNGVIGDLLQETEKV